MNPGSVRYERPTVIEHDSGHAIVRRLTKERLEIAAKFMIRQYLRKNIDHITDAMIIVEQFNASLS